MCSWWCVKLYLLYILLQYIQFVSANCNLPAFRILCPFYLLFLRLVFFYFDFPPPSPQSVLYGLPPLPFYESVTSHIPSYGHTTLPPLSPSQIFRFFEPFPAHLQSKFEKSTNMTLKYFLFLKNRERCQKT
jgi:hypothetical protein